MPANLTIWLIRHPAPAISQGTCYGQTDVGLAETVFDALARMSQGGCEPARLAAVFSSPWTRCRTLAEALGTHSVLDARLSEINFGAWEGRHWDDIGRDALDLWAANPLGFAPPGGESARDMATRVVSFATDFSCQIRAMARQTSVREVAIVAHQGPLRVLHAHWHGESDAVWLTRQFGYAEPVPLVLDPCCSDSVLVRARTEFFC